MDDTVSVDDAILEDMVHCRYCGASCDVSDVTLYGTEYDVQTNTRSGGVVICEDCTERFDRDPDVLITEVVRLREVLAFYEECQEDVSREWRRAEGYRAALKAIQGWDCLNPPNADLCADLPWLRRLVDAALAGPAPETVQNRARMPSEGVQRATTEEVPASRESGTQTREIEG